MSWVRHDPTEARCPEDVLDFLVRYAKWPKWRRWAWRVFGR